MFIRIKDGKPEYYTLAQLRQSNPHTSFPKNPPADLLAAYDVHPVKRTPPPVYDGLRQIIRVIDAVEIDGQWTQQWETLDLPVSRQREHLQAARAKEYIKEADPLFFKWQAGEGTAEEWKARREEIRARYPYPEE